MFNTKFILLAVAAATVSTVCAFDIEPRIEGGEDAVQGQFPFYALLNIITFEGNYTCGGSLISNQWIVTTAHCLNGAYRVEVHLGSLKTNKVNEKGRVTITTIKQQDIILHPSYVDIVDLFLRNDIGLVKLPTPVEFNDIIKPVKLSCNAPNNADVIAIGNGLNNTDESVAPILRYTHLKTVAGRKCLIEFKIRWIQSGEICAVGEGKRSVCGRDLGGPLISAKSGTLFGVTSLRSLDGCDLGKPQGFTSIPLQFEWIGKVTGIQSCQ